MAGGKNTLRTQQTKHAEKEVAVLKRKKNQSVLGGKAFLLKKSRSVAGTEEGK